MRVIQIENWFAGLMNTLIALHCAAVYIFSMYPSSFPNGKWMFQFVGNPHGAYWFLWSCPPVSFLCFLIGLWYLRGTVGPTPE